MSRLRVAPIVEGHGDANSIRLLLDRVWREVVGGEFVDVQQPIRCKRHRLVTDKDGELSKAVNLAAGKLRQAGPSDDRELILILIDADDDLPCVLGPELLAIAKRARSDCDIASVVANADYETWFVAAAESLSDFLEIGGNEPAADPETQRHGKGWIKTRFKTFKYSETVDQPKLTVRFDLVECRSRAPSFDKLCRDLEARFQPGESL